MMLIDQDTVKRRDQIVSAWIMTVREEMGDGNWNVSELMRQIDCQRHSIQTLRSKFYSDSALVEDSSEPGEWTGIKTGSMIEGVADVMCGRAEYQTEVLADPASAVFEYWETTLPD